MHVSILSLPAKQEKQLVAANNVRQSEVMKVDVGGSSFHVSRSTLVAQPNSLLDSLFSGRFRIDTQADGSLFIDRLQVLCPSSFFCCRVAYRVENSAPLPLQGS